MSLGIPELAVRLEVDGRTLRRAVARGAIRAYRPSPRRLRLEPGEYDYLRTHWHLISALTEALRTERGVRLAVLYGSAARGDDRSDSDLDLLVDPRATGFNRSELAHRLSRATGRPVDIARLSFVRESSPPLLLRAIDEGRVLVDRDGVWPALAAERTAVATKASHETQNEINAAARALAELAD